MPPPAPTDPETKATVFVNNTDLLPRNWRFIEPFWADPRAEWQFFYGTAQNRLERTITRPHLGRYRAALQAVRAAAGAHQPSILVSHLPAMAAATNAMRKLICPQVRQIAFAFNFTDLPTGARRRYFRRALQGVEEFVVFSEMERRLYSDVLGLPPDRLRMLHWATEAPEAGPDNPVPAPEVPYLCAIGGEARDYRLLADVMRQEPQMRMVIVARPYSIAGIDFSDNVQVFTNLPAPQTWRLAQDSLGLVIPLRSEDTACGHITIVGAQMLGIPLVVTRSAGVADYTDDSNALLVAPGSGQDLRAGLQTLAAQGDAVHQRSHRALETARQRSDLAHWVRYFESLLAR